MGVKSVDIRGFYHKELDVSGVSCTLGCRQVILGELVGGLAEGGPLLLPFLVRGAVKAVRLFCSKVHTSPVSTPSYPCRFPGI